MYITCFCGSNNFSFEKLNFEFYKFFTILILTGMDCFFLNKIIFNCLKLFCLKKNILIFQFKNKFNYNNLIFYNNYIYFFYKKFSNIFINISDYGYIFSLNFINFSNYIINLHNSLLLSFRGCNPVLGIIKYFNNILASSIIYLKKDIDLGKKINFYKIYRKYNYNYNIIKYNFSLINSFLFNKILYYCIKFFIYGFGHGKTINFFYKTK